MQYQYTVYTITHQDNISVVDFSATLVSKQFHRKYFY